MHLFDIFINAQKSTIKRITKRVQKKRIKRRTSTKVILKAKRGEYLQYKEGARVIAYRYLEVYMQKYTELGIIIDPFKKVFIKNTISRWGSCSSKKNLNFSYRLAIIPQHLAEYIVVHELCHLKEFNHAKSFWDLVALTIPDYESRKEELRKLSLRK